MKARIYIIKIIMALVFISCDEYLDKLPPDSLVEDNAITDQAGAEAALIGAFYPMKSFNPPIFGANYISDGSQMVGLTTGSYTPFDDQCELNNFAEGNGWEHCSAMINSTNFVIEKVVALDESLFSSNRKTEIIAEATFLRFFAQYYLLRYYSQFWEIDSQYGALMRREPARVSNNDHARSTVAETYTLLLEDLDFVIQNGQEFNTVYRPSKLLAKAFKAEVLLMRGQNDDYQRAIQLANEVLNDSKRQKETGYADIFDNGYNSSELLFTRYMDDNMLNNVFAGLASIVRMFGGVFETTPLFETILVDDARAPFYKREDVVDGETVIRVPKLYKEDGNCLPYYMRTSQMHLVIAEAKAKLNMKNEAVAALNILRQRAGEDALSASEISDNELQTVIFHEIVKEMALENGYEWTSSIRLNGIDGNRLIFSIKPSVLSEKQFIWPLPQGEVDHNSLVEQNPGYEHLY